MNLLKKVNEDAAGGAVGGGDVAAFAMPMFASIVKRNIPTTAKVIKYGKKKKDKSLSLKEAFRNLHEAGDAGFGADENGDQAVRGPSFDTSEVVSKLKSLENKEKTDTRDTTVYGLEDSDGGMVRVTIKNEQAAEFEKALQQYMTDLDDEEDVPEIAEMLFKLKDHFDIVNVEWPEVQEDEEQEQVVGGEEGGAAPGGAEGGDLLGGEEGGAEGGDLLGGEEGGAGGEDTNQIKDLLGQVIDMMKADAEARKAEAKAREVEAAVKQVNARVKQEEQLLDMDAYNKSKKDEEKEAKRLASLAQWKRETSQGENTDDMFGGSRGASEEEEILRQPTHRSIEPQQTVQPKAGRVHPHDIAHFILKRIK